MAFAAGGYVIRHSKAGMDALHCAECTDLIGIDDGEVYYDHKVTHRILCEDCYAKERADAPAPTKKSYYKPKGSRSTKEVPLQVLTTVNPQGEVETVVEPYPAVEDLKQHLWNAETKQIKKWQKDSSSNVRALADKATEKRGLDIGPVVCSRCGKSLLNVVHKKINNERVCWECSVKPGRSE